MALTMALCFGNGVMDLKLALWFLQCRYEVETGVMALEMALCI